jgi:ketosteroid isomerase-like protein
MAHPNEDLMRENFAATGRGDYDAPQKNWAEDIRYHFPEGSPIAGDYQGIEQVRQLFARMAEQAGTVSVELHDVLANDDYAVAMITTRGEQAGQQLNGNMVVVYHFRDGKVTEVWTHLSDLYALDEFWS